MDPPRVAKLNVYPVKSCKALSVSEIEFDDFGVIGDRRFMMIDQNNHYLSQRRYGVMATVISKLTVENGREYLSLSAPSVNWNLKLEPVVEGPRIDAHLWDCSVRAIDQGDEAARWCTELIGPDSGGKVYLVASAEGSSVGERYRRPVENVPKKLESKVPGVQVGLANESPVSLVSQESLGDLNEKMTQNGVNEVGLDRFRMNIEIAGCSRPFEEDEWLQIRIGEIPFLVYEYCGRCNMTGVNQETGVADKTRPNNILRKYRAPQGPIQASFGQHLIPLQKSGKVHVGDTIQIIERKR